MKKNLFLLLSFMMVMTSSLFASEYIWYGDLYYYINTDNHTASVEKPASWDGHRQSDVVIPPFVIYQGQQYPVISIGSYAFRDHDTYTDDTKMTTVTIGENIGASDGYISSNAFQSCRYITTVNYNATHLEITYSPMQPLQLIFSFFSDSNGTFTTLNIGNNVTLIPTCFFNGCTNIQEVTLPSSLIEIGEWAFNGCTSLKSLVIPSSVQTIGECAFRSCTLLDYVEAFPTTPPTVGLNSFNFSSDITLHVLESAYTAYAADPEWGRMRLEHAPVCISYQGNDLYYSLDASNHTAAVIFPNFMNTSTQGYWGAYLKPSGVVSIPSSFTYNNATYQVTSIAPHAFDGCTAITSFVTGQYLTKVSNYAFANCTGLTTVNIAETVTTVEPKAFSGCDHITTVHFNPANCTTMADGNLSVFNDSRNTINTISFNNNIIKIPSYIFKNCTHIASVILPSTLQSIGSHAFENCTGLSSVVLNATTVEGYAFAHCTGLTEVTIGNGVTSVEGSAFSECDHIVTLNFNAVNCTSMRRDISTNSYSSQYISAFYESRTTITSLNIGNTVGTIPATAFKDFSRITSLSIPSSVNTIGNEAFSGCVGLSSVSVNVSELSTALFKNCTGLTTVTIGPKVTRVPGSAFDGCNHIVTVYFDAQNCTLMNGTRYHDYSPYAAYSVSAFYDSRSTLTTVYVGSGVTNIPDYAFKVNALQTIESYAVTPPTLYNHSFNYSSSIPLWVPVLAYSDYHDHAFWGRFLNRSQLRVAGFNVTSNNASDILGDQKVSYDAQTNCLILHDATIAAGSSVGIDNLIPDLSIVLKGVNTITSSKEGIVSGPDMSITHGASNGVLHVTGQNSAILGSAEGTLTISASTVSATTNSGSNGVISGFGDLILNDCDFYQPYGAVWNATTHRLEQDGHPVTGQAIVGPAPDLWIAGTQVTQANFADVLGDGTVRYDVLSRMLYLTNAELNPTDVEGIRIQETDLTIVLAGHNSITATSADGIYSWYPFTIEGNGTLDVTGINGISAEAALTIQGGCRVNAVATGSGSCSALLGHSIGNLNILSSYVTATANSNSTDGSISGFAGLSLFGCEILSPSGAVWSNAHNRVEWNEQVVKDKVVIGSEYQLYVAGVQVTDDNADDVLGDQTVSYDAHTNVLALNGADLTAPENTRGIYSVIPDLTIALSGNNTVRGTNHTGIESYNLYDLTIEGSGILDVTGDDGIDAGGNLTIQGGCTIHAVGTGTGPHFGITAGYENTVTIDHSTVTASVTPNSTSGSFSGMHDLQLIGCQIYAPDGAVWNPSYYSIVVGEDDPQVVHGEVVIDISRNLWVAGVQVTEGNKNDVLGDGTVSFNTLTNTLTLSGVDLNLTDVKGIENGLDDLTLFVEGYNTIVTNDVALSSCSSDLNIAGTGTLNVTGSDGIDVTGSDLTLQGGCVVYAVGTGEESSAGIKGSMDKSLTVNASSLAATASPASTLGSIYGFSTLTMVDCGIISPEGAVWNADTRRLELGNHLVTERVEIGTAYNLWVGGVHVNTAIAHNVLGDAGRSVRYDASNNTLYLTAATIENGFGKGIENSIPNLVIWLSGYNEILSRDEGIFSERDISLDGYGRLVVTGEIGIWVDGALTIGGDKVRAVSTDGVSSPIHCEEGLTLTDYSIISPLGAVWNGTDLEDADGNLLTGTVVIDDPEFRLYVADVQVTLDNATHITGEGINGMVSYNPGEKTLVLDNATITATGQGIRNEIFGLRILLMGNNTIEASSVGIYCEEGSDLVIDGSGTLNVTGGSQGIFAYVANLTLQGGCVVNAHGADGIGVEGSDDAELNILNASLVAQGGPHSLSIGGFSSLNRVGCSILEPKGSVYYYDEHLDYHYMADSGGNAIKTSVVIGTSYDMTVANVPVTSVNAAHVTGSGITGSVSYDVASNVLTFNNATITGSSYCFHNNRDGLTLQLVGNSTLTATGNYAHVVFLDADLSIEGPGALSIDARNAGAGVYSDGVDLTIKDGCLVKVTGSEQTYEGVSIHGRLTVDDAVLVVDNTSEYNGLAVYSSDSLVTIGCEITVPNNAAWNINTGEVELQGATVTKFLVIGCYDYDLYVGEVQLNTCNALDLLDDGGTVSFDCTTNTLTLHNAQIVSPTQDGVLSELVEEVLTICLIGNNTIESPQAHGLELYGPVSLLGPGTLTIDAGVSGIVSQDDLLMDHCTVAVEAEEYGVSIAGELELTETLLMAAGGGNDASVLAYSLTLVDAQITRPEGAEWDDGVVEDSQGCEVYSQVVIQPVKTFNDIEDNDWSEPLNWSPEGLPTQRDKVIIEATCNLYDEAVVDHIVVSGDGKLQIQSGAVVEADSILNASAQGMRIEDGGQVIAYGGQFVATCIKTVGSWNEEPGWYLVSQPGTGTSTFHGVEGVKDLYRYNETNRNGQEWENDLVGQFNAELGRGYLFAIQEEGDCQYDGTVNVDDVEITLTYTAPQNDYPLAGFNLIGNPFTHSIYKGEGCAIDNEHLAPGYFVLDANGNWVERSDDEPIAPFQAILVRTDATTTLHIKNKCSK